MRLHRAHASRIGARGVAGVAVAMVLAACGGGGGSPGEGGGTNGALPVRISLIGPPPLNLSLWANVADQQGYFKDVGLAPSFKYFGHGADVAKTVVSKSVDVGMAPTTAVLELNSKGTPIVAVAGMDNEDWIVGTSVPNATSCDTLKGLTIADDGPENARRIFLSQMLTGCGESLDDTKHVAIGATPANIVAAAAAGQVKAAVLHAPELAQVNAKAKVKWHAVHPANSVTAHSHYSTFSVLKSYLATPTGKKVATRTVAAYILARAWIMDPKNQRAFAALTAKAQGISEPVALAGIKLLATVPFWTPGLGLKRGNIAGETQLLVQGGSIEASQKPSYSQVVDTGIFPAALALAKKFNPHAS